MSLESQLKEFLEGYEKLVILGVGNELKCDDGVGPFIINKLPKKNNLVLINGQTVPENFTGKIKKEKPSHVIIIDACLMDESPGTIKIVDRKDFVNIGISTHSMSLSYFVKYLEIDSSFKILFIGIEPESMDYSTKLSKKIEESANELKDIIEGII